MKRHVVWFRSDLRIYDNTALSAACEDPDVQVFALFIASPKQWRQHDMAAVRQRFILRNVKSLAAELQRLNIPLVFLEIDSYRQLPTRLAQWLSQYGVARLYANHEYGWNEKVRDEAVVDELAIGDCQFHRFHDQSMLPPGLTTQAGTPYTVFTPFKRAWLKQWRLTRPGLCSAPARRTPIDNSALPAVPDCLVSDVFHQDSTPQAVEHHAIDTLWPAGEREALRRLRQFVDASIAGYQQRRDLPAAAGTSTLSPWLAAGVISPRHCLFAALEANDGRLDGGQQGIECWVSELIWRDFYIHILDSFPEVSRHRAFRNDTERLPWRQADDDFSAWRAGRTGFPIVDAGMRQLAQTGWMHNRVRMITAMFLSKHLLIDWRRGERVFMQQLVDGFLAANNGGWQWAASTGTDAVPYFRVFNPVTQSQRFDPAGSYIRQYLPELASLDDAAIHAPATKLLGTVIDYPVPIVDLKLGRERAIAAHRCVRERGEDSVPN